MSHSMEVFVKVIPRIIFGGFGLFQLLMAVGMQLGLSHPRPPGKAIPPEMALLFILLFYYGGAAALTIGLWGGFPAWSHAFIPRTLREQFRALYKAREVAQANPVSPYGRWSRLQVRLVQWAMVPLFGWLFTLLGFAVTFFGRTTWVVGACVGGILAVVLANVLKRL